MCMRRRTAPARVLFKAAAKRCSCRPVEWGLSVFCSVERDCVRHLVTAVVRRRVCAEGDRRLGAVDAVEDRVPSS